MYGDNYGYRSSLNRTMVDHLNGVVRLAMSLVTLETDDYVVDIGSNDSTLLQAYPQVNINLVGIDPTGGKFKRYYPAHIRLIPNFFSADTFRKEIGDHKAKIVTSIAMFYDLEDPVGFMRDVYDILADNGVWICEQSYMPTMLANRSYDTICHEHLEYYALAQIKWMADRVGFRVLDVGMNSINGGSFWVALSKSDTISHPGADIDALVASEMRSGLFALEPYHAFARAVKRSKQELCSFIAQANSAGDVICGLGASTKGNTILQYCNITETELPCIGEINDDKYGCFTPGTGIPIVSEQEMLDMKPDYLLILPWHFRSFFESNSAYAGNALVFPLPSLIVRAV